MPERDPKLYVLAHQRQLVKDWQQETQILPIPVELREKVGRREVACPVCNGFGSPIITFVSPSTGKWYSEYGGGCECLLLRRIFGKLDKTVPPHYKYVTLKTLQPSHQSMLPLDYQAELLNEMREHPQDGYAFFGPAGTSKTTLTTALYRRAVVADETVHWRRGVMGSACWRTTVKQLTDEFIHFATAKDFVDDDGVRHRAKEPTVTRRKIIDASLAGFKPRLFLEEIDKMKGSEFKQQELFEVLNGLYEHNGQLVINTNMTPEEFSREFGAAFERRIAEMCRMKDFFGVTV